MKQNLERSLGLNQAKLTQIHQLELACNKFDGLTMRLNWNMLTNRPTDQVNDFLYYVNGALVGYLALYEFNPHEAEVSAMTHPRYRQQGIFKRLLAAAGAELQQRKIPNFLFICERSSNSGIRSAQALKAVYEFSEYKMDLKATPQITPLPEGLQLQSAQVEDIKVLAQMDSLCFGVTFEAAQRWLEYDLVDNQRRVLVAAIKQVKIGKIGVLMNETETYIAGFCLLPEFRGQGYGKAILTHTVAQLLAEQRPSICLEVACSNEQALSLYRRCSFEVTTSYDYYRLPVGKR